MTARARSGGKRSARGDLRGSVVSNGSWATLQQLVNVGSQALLSFLLIVALSVKDFGTYSYAIVLASLAINFMTAGLAGLAIKVLVAAGEQTASLVTSILVIREVMAALAFVILTSVSFTSGSSSVIVASMIAGLAVFARAADAPEYWFKARLRTREPAVIRIAVSIVALGARIGGIAVAADVEFFLITYVLEAAVGSAIVLFRYWRLQREAAFARPRRGEALALMRKSFPLLLSGIANQINLRGDVLVIQVVLGTPSVAVYSAASRLAELTYFIPTVFMNATLPGLVELHAKHGEHSEVFRRTMQRSYDRAFWAGVLIAAATAAAGSFVIVTFFGPEYQRAVPLLLIGLIACPFMFMGAVYSKWILTVDTLWSSTARNALGAVANIALNFAFLPMIGLVGASIATVASYVLASYLACFIGRRTRIAGVQMSLALIAPFRAAVTVVRRRRA